MVPVTDGTGRTTNHSPTQTGSRTNRPSMNIVPWLHWTQKTVSGGLKVVSFTTVWPVNHQKVDQMLMLHCPHHCCSCGFKIIAYLNIRWTGLPRRFCRIQWKLLLSRADIHLRVCRCRERLCQPKCTFNVNSSKLSNSNFL